MKSRSYAIIAQDWEKGNKAANSSLTLPVKLQVGFWIATNLSWNSMKYTGLIS